MLIQVFDSFFDFFSIVFTLVFKKNIWLLQGIILLWHCEMRNLISPYSQFETIVWNWSHGIECGFISYEGISYSSVKSIRWCYICISTTNCCCIQSANLHFWFLQNLIQEKRLKSSERSVDFDIGIFMWSCESCHNKTIGQLYYRRQKPIIPW